MKRKAVYRSWAPSEGSWTSWVKPVLFSALDEESLVQEDQLPSAPVWFEQHLLAPLAEGAVSADEHPYRASHAVRDVALVIDLPGASGTEVGLHAAERGYRPIPLYNAVHSKVAVVDVSEILHALVHGAERVARVPVNAPPAFLLDANRMGGDRVLRPGLFDNRSVCRIADFPSAETLMDAGIARAVLVCEGSPASDLESVLLAWQESGIALWSKRPDDDRDVAPFVLARRSWFRRIPDAIRAALLARRSDGSYGRVIEAPSGG